MPKQSVFDPCYYCQATRLVKTGSPKAGNQGYLCRACGKYYSEATIRREPARQQAIALMREGWMLAYVSRKTGITPDALKNLRAQAFPEGAPESRKYENLAEFLECVQRCKLTPAQRAKAAQWITPRAAMEILGLTRKSITFLVKHKYLVGRKEHNHLWVSLPSVQAYRPLRVRRAERRQQDHPPAAQKQSKQSRTRKDPVATSKPSK